MGVSAIRIENTDCLEGLRALDDASVDLAFADPPFNIGYKYDVYDDCQHDDTYLSWCRDWLTQIKRVLKADGTFWLAIGDEYAAELKVMMQRELQLACRSWVIWYYTFGVNCTRKFSRSHAHLFHMVKDPNCFTFNAEQIRVPSARQLVYGDRRANPKGRLPDDTWILRPQDTPESFSSEEDTWYFARVAGTFKERSGFHGCQMPEQLLGRIVRVSSDEGGLVLDPFVGSGTTPAVAKKLRRRFIGFEVSPEYTEKATARVAAIKPGDPLDGAAEPTVSAPSTAAGRRLDQRKKKKRPRKTQKQETAQQDLPGL
ncbi:MAG: DNA methyltransferase [Pirellulales bacterium]